MVMTWDPSFCVNVPASSKRKHFLTAWEPPRNVQLGKINRITHAGGQGIFCSRTGTYLLPGLSVMFVHDVSSGF